MNQLIGMFNIIIGFSMMTADTAGISGLIVASYGQHIYIAICFICAVYALSSKPGSSTFISTLPMLIIAIFVMIQYSDSVTAVVVYGSAWMIPNVMYLKNAGSWITDTYNFRNILGLTMGIMAIAAIANPDGPGLNYIYETLSYLEHPSSAYYILLILGSLLLLIPIGKVYMVPYISCLGIFFHIGTFVFVSFISGHWASTVLLLYAFTMWFIAAREVNHDVDGTSTAPIVSTN